MEDKSISKPMVIILCMIILSCAVFSLRQYSRYIRFDLIVQYKNQISGVISQNHGTLTEKNTNLIDSWMTFDYINTIFKLPKDYLKNSLNISDPHYPRILISRYAKTNKLDIKTFISKIKDSVNSYFLNQGIK